MNKFEEKLLPNKNFCRTYFPFYFKLLKKPVIIGSIGALSLALCLLGPIGALISLFISTPCLCYAFWQGYLITYALIYASEAHSFNNEPNLSDCFEMTKIKGNQLALFLLFSMIITLALMFPTLIALIFSFDISTLHIKPIFYVIAFINSVALFPFSNFLNQAFFYKKDDEKFIDLFLNCYKKLNKEGIILSVIFSLIPTVIGGICPLGYFFIALLLNPFIYYTNTIWYKNQN
ncbi:MAG: hypothetical protein IKL52_00375 [Candidatus Gastranaerophilales bacterium]|nr:hypothetical protein [Candidatus Gastranaerophilales bacterium]